VPKQIPDCPKKPNPAIDAGHSYEIELMTPMFGGGVEPRAIDPSFPIRPTAIRGQLQFWWRATIGARCQTLPELRTAQAEIWGSTDRASRVRVLVENIQTTAPAPCARIEWDQRARGGKRAWRTNWRAPFDQRDSALPYVLFPFQGETPSGRADSTVTVPPAACIHRASFRLTLYCPKDLWTEVEPAVWAWANLGGLGGRTRRGCGALYCQDLAPPTIASLADRCPLPWRHVPMASEATIGPASASSRTWPTISQMLIRNEPQDPFTVWDRLMGMYRYFRQGEDFARDPGPGQSRYPEADTVRRITGRHMRKHAPWKGMPDGFPRAELGLPIVFHFKDEDKGEPRTTTLCPVVEGKTVERMSSPLILKPLALAGNMAVPLVLCLNTTGVERVELQDENKKLLKPLHAVRVRSPIFALEGLPLHGLSAAGSALEAFLAFARTKGFKEIAP
jgi:CRISPR-associated protein Cmr1